MSRLKNVFKKLTLAAGLLFMASLCRATDVAYSGVFVGTEGRATATGSASSATYTRDLNTTGNLISFQIVQSTYTGASSAKTFTNGSTSSGTFTVGAPAGAISAPTVTINGISVPYTYNTNFASMTATNICSSMTATAAVASIVRCTSAGSVVYTTSTVVGILTNAYTLASSTAAVTRSATTMLGGTNSAYTINTPTITITSNGFVTGLQVLYSGTPVISGLTTGTTYFVSVINPNTLGQSATFKLSSSLANAVAGTGIVLASSQTKTTADTYTLLPLTFVNTSGGGVQLQYSDDRANWSNATTGNYGVAIASVTFTSTGGSTLYDLGVVSHRYLRAVVTPPTSGAATYTMYDNERYTTGDH